MLQVYFSRKPRVKTKQNRIRKWGCTKEIFLFPTKLHKQ